MERLTEKNQDLAWIKGHLSDSCTEMCEEVHGECWRCDLNFCMEKLADYEDAEENGRLKIFPVAPGDHVWYVEYSKKYSIAEIKEYIIYDVSLDIDNMAWAYTKEAENLENIFSMNLFSFWGKCVFATQEEAEAKLKEWEKEDG